MNGKRVAVPANIGIDQQAQQISPLHTHDTNGVIHIESPVKATFSLGQLMTEWDVALTQDSIGGLKAGGGSECHAYVNGKERPGIPAAIEFRAHDEIVLVYGPADLKGRRAQQLRLARRRMTRGYGTRVGRIRR